MVNVAPKAIIAVAAFRNKTMNMGIPFEISSKGMIKPGVKFLDLLRLKNILETTLVTA